MKFFSEMGGKCYGMRIGIVIQNDRILALVEWLECTRVWLIQRAKKFFGHKKLREYGGHSK